MDFSAPNLGEGPNPIEPISRSLHEAMMRVRGDINKMVEIQLEKIFGKAVLNLYVESGERVPGVELDVKQSGEPPDRITIKATLRFKGNILTEETYVLERNKI